MLIMRNQLANWTAETVFTVKIIHKKIHSEISVFKPRFFSVFKLEPLLVKKEKKEKNRDGHSHT